MFATQYLNSPDQTNQQPQMFDVKNSPLALLAQTCNSIGKDVIPFNRTLSSSTSTTFSILPCNGSRGHDPNKNDDHSREHLRCSSEDDVTSTMMTSCKARDYSRKNNDARKNSTSSEQNCDEDHLDVVGFMGNRIRDHDDDVVERNPEPMPLISKHQNKTSAPKAKGGQAAKSSSNSSGSSSKRNASAKHGADGNSKKSENRNSKDHRMTDHSKKSDSWLINLPFKQTGFAPGVDGIYPGYFNFFPPDYTNFLKNYYMSQINAHPTAPFLNFSFSTFSDQLSKLRASPQSLYSFSPLQPPPHSPPSVGAKSRGDLFGKQLNNPERSLPNNFLPSPLLANPLLQSSKDLQNLSYLHFLSQQNPMLLSAHAPLSCPFPFKPIGESCSKLFGSFDEVMDHVKLHWIEGKDNSTPIDPSIFSIFPPIAYPPYSWSLKAYEDTSQQVGKFATTPGISNRFHPYVKPFLSNHVP